MKDKALVRNAADPRQVRSAKKKEEGIRFKELNEMRVVMNSLEGRSFMFRMLDRYSAYSSVYDRNALSMSYQAGQQDVSHYLMGEILEADKELYFLMLKENERKEKNDDV